MDNIVVDKVDKVNNIARVEFYGVMIEIPFTDLPDGCKEGSVLSLIENKSTKNRDSVKSLEQELFG